MLEGVSCCKLGSRSEEQGRKTRTRNRHQTSSLFLLSLLIDQGQPIGDSTRALTNTIKHRNIPVDSFLPIPFPSSSIFSPTSLSLPLYGHRSSFDNVYSLSPTRTPSPDFLSHFHRNFQRFPPHFSPTLRSRSTLLLPRSFNVDYSSSISTRF